MGKFKSFKAQIFGDIFGMIAILTTYLTGSIITLFPIMRLTHYLGFVREKNINIIPAIDAV